MLSVLAQIDLLKLESERNQRALVDENKVNSTGGGGGGGGGVYTYSVPVLLGMSDSVREETQSAFLSQ